MCVSRELALGEAAEPRFKSCYAAFKAAEPRSMATASRSRFKRPSAVQSDYVAVQVLLRSIQGLKGWGRYFVTLLLCYFDSYASHDVGRLHIGIGVKLGKDGKGDAA